MDKYAHTLLFCAVVALLPSISINAQKIRAEFVPENAAADLDQCRNGTADAPGPQCADLGGNLGWVNGQAGSGNSHWAEDQFLTYRMKFTDLSTTGTREVIIGYDYLDGSTHSIDYLGTYNETETDANPCDGINPTPCADAPSTFPIPKDTTTVHEFNNPNTGLPIIQKDGVFTMWGGTITDASYVNPPSAGKRQIRVQFTASVSNPVLAWGGHIAWIGDWGAGNSAGSISGSSYHMRLISLDGSGGNQDRALSAAGAVIPSGAVIIIKKVETFDNQDQADIFFPFQASSFFSPLLFQLKDVNDGVQDRKLSSAVTLFGGANAITVTETPTAGFDLLDALCTESGTPDSARIGTTSSVNIIVQFGEVVTCTFTNSLIAPSAAPVSISGRVTDAYGRGISGARLTITNANSGSVSVVSSNTFGYYRINDLAAGDLYILSAAHKRFSFNPGTISLSPVDNLTGVDFRGSN